MLDPHGRVAMVSGAARGIGRAVVERLLASGFRVSAGVRDARGLRDSERLLGATFVGERRRQRLERQRLGIVRRVICRVAQHRLSGL